MIINNNFYGKIDEKTIYDFSRLLNYNLSSTEERLELVKSLLYNEDGTKQKFFEEVFTQKFDLKKEIEEDLNENEENLRKLSFTGANTSAIKLILSKEDALYTESNIGKELEKITNYILFSLPKKQRREYKIYKDEQLFQKMIKEQSVEGENGADTDLILHFLMKNNQNFKLEKKQKVEECDIEEIPELKEYKIMLDSISFKLRRISLLEKLYGKTKSFTDLDVLTLEDKVLLKEYKIKTDDLTKNFYKENQRQKSLLQKQSALIKEDMLYIKDCKKGTIYFKQPLADSTEIDYDMLDWNNTEQVEALLRIPPKGEDLQNDIVCIQNDLEQLIKDCNFSERDLEILDMYRVGMTLEGIGKKFKITKKAVDKYIEKIVNKIINTYNERYEDWYYLEVEKGTYKTCSKCGEVKLANERNFAKDKSKKDGFKYQCKACLEKNKTKNKKYGDKKGTQNKK